MLGIVFNVNDFYTHIMLSYSCLISHADDRGHV